MRTRTVIRRRLSVINGRPFTRPIRAILRFLLGILRTISRNISFPFQRIRNFIRFVQRRHMFLSDTSRINTAGRIKVGTRHVTLQLRHFTHVFCTSRLSKYRASRQTFLMVMSLTTMGRITILFIFRGGRMGTRYVPRIIRQFNL